MKAMTASFSRLIGWLRFALMPDATATSTNSNWSDYNQDLIRTIFEKLIDNIDDIITCSRVCVSWHQSFEQFFPAPFILFTYQGYTREKIVEDEDSISGRRYFYAIDVPENDEQYRLFNTRTGKTEEMRLLELHGRYFCAASHGWLLSANAGCDFLQEMTLLNPLTLAEIKLPCPWKETSRSQRHFRVITSLAPSNPNTIVSGLYMGDYRVGFYRQGDQTWNKIAFCHEFSSVNDALFFKGEFYFVGYNNNVAYSHYLYRIRFDESVPDLSPSMERLLLLPKSDDNLLNRIDYLVELMGELCLVSIYYRGSYYQEYVYRWRSKEVQDKLEFDGMSIHKLEFDGMESRWVKLTSLGEYAIYSGFCQSVSVFVGEGNCKESRQNCVYFIANTSDRGEGDFHSVVKVFDLEKKCFEDLYVEIPVQNTLLSWFKFPIIDEFETSKLDQ